MDGFFASAARRGADLHRAETGLRPGRFGRLIVRQVVVEVTSIERGNEALLIKHLS